MAVGFFFFPFFLNYYYVTEKSCYITTRGIVIHDCLLGNFASEKTPDGEGGGEGVCIGKGWGGEGGAQHVAAGDPVDDGSGPSAARKLSSGPGDFGL